MSSAAITAELREYARQAVHRNDYMAGLSYDLDRIADRIDAEHERRMDDCRREVVRCSDCLFAHPRVDGLMQCDITRLVNHGNFYCANGARREVDE